MAAAVTRCDLGDAGGGKPGHPQAGACSANAGRRHSIGPEDAEAIYDDLSSLSDNEEWQRKLRGGYSRRLTGENRDSPIILIDLKQPRRNRFRDMLEQHVHVTGLSTTIRLRNITDPNFVDGFATEEKSDAELQEAFVRKSAELRRVTRELVDKNPAQYGRFSERVLEIIRRFVAGQIAAAEGSADTEHAALQDAAIAIGAVYVGAKASQPAFTHMPEYLRSLRQQVRRILNERGIGETKAIRDAVEAFAIHAFENRH